MKRIVMIGAPVTSVRTPPLLTAFLAAHGVRARVDVAHVEAEALAAFMAGVAADPAIDGLMVTMPHKRAIVPFLHDLSAEARAIGAVNAVKRVGGELLGAQFDGVGLREAVRAAGVDLAAARVWLMGLGGAGAAIANALHAAGCLDLMLSDADPDRARLVAAPLGPPARIVAAASRPAADLLVNATPLGMKSADLSPFDEASIANAFAVADIVAVPNETRLAALATAAGKTLVTGFDTVRGQVGPIGRWLLSDDLAQE